MRAAIKCPCCGVDGPEVTEAVYGRLVRLHADFLDIVCSDDCAESCQELNEEETDDDS